jgi:hypothetical protein
MINVFTAFGFYLMKLTGIFGTALDKSSGIYGTVQNVLTTTWFTIPGINYHFTGITALAGLMVAATLVVLSSSITTPQGIAIGAYVLVFFSSLFMIGYSLFIDTNVFKDFPMMAVFFGLYLFIGTVAFVYTLVQMGSGGQKMID